MTKNKLVGEKAEAAPPQLTVTGKLEVRPPPASFLCLPRPVADARGEQHTAPIQVEDYLYVQSCLTGKDSQVKVAIPSPTMVRALLPPLRELS